MRLTRKAIVALLIFATPAGAQKVPELHYAPDFTLNLIKAGVKRTSQMSVDRHGTMVVVHEIYPPELIAFDSLGNKHPWPLQVGRRSGKSDVAWVRTNGWVGDSMWIADDYFNQLAVIAPSGRMIRSIERPSWVRPFWSERRKYPFFRGLDWLALYKDTTMLVVPRSPRPLFDTPEYDRSKTYLMRVNADGQILRTVAKLNLGTNALYLRDGMERKQIGLPFFVRNAWKVSADGQRIAVVEPLMTAADSGAFIVTALTRDGDTVFSRRYTVETERVPQAQVDKFLAELKPFGRYSTDWMRDTLRKMIPAFQSRVLNVSVGMDYSVWVWLRMPVPENRAFVIDATGEPVGTAGFPSVWRFGELTIDRIWTTQRVGPVGNPREHSIVRMSRVAPKGARPSRSASTSASSQR